MAERGRFIAVSLLKNVFFGMVILGAIFFCSLVFAVDIYALNGFYVWWIAAVFICYFYWNFASKGPYVKRTDGDEKKRHDKIIVFEFAALYCIMPFICMLFALIVLSPALFVLSVLSGIEYVGVSYDPDAEYIFRR